MTKNDDTIMAITAHQHKLRSLTAFGAIEERAFKSMCRLERLEVLKTSIERIDGSCLDDLKLLRNLKVLELRKDESGIDFGRVWPGVQHLSQTKWPQLLMMVLDVGLNMIDANDFAMLGDNATNLQTLEVRSYDFAILPAVFEKFSSLKMLRVFAAINHSPNATSSIPNNTNLEEIVISADDGCSLAQPVYNRINASPNLRSITLEGIGFFGPEILNIMQKHTCLKEFTFVAKNTSLNINCGDAVNDNLEEIISHFIAAPDFSILRLENVPGISEERIRDLFPDVIIRIAFSLTSKPDGMNVLKFEKQ